MPEQDNKGNGQSDQHNETHSDKELPPDQAFPLSSAEELKQAVANAGLPLLAQQAMATRQLLAELHGSDVAVLQQAAQTVRDSLQRLREGSIRPFQQFQLGLAKIVRAVARPYVQVALAAQDIKKQLDSVQSPFQQIRKQIAELPLFQPEFRDALAKAVTALQERWDREERQAFVLFAKRGLVGLESHLTSEQVSHLLKLQKEKGLKAVDAFIFRIFRHKDFALLRQMMRSWWRVPYMKKRRKAVRLAIKAHRERQYELSIPTLLPFIDGLAAVVMDGKVGKSSKTILVKDAVADYRVGNDFELAAECVQTVVDALVYKHYQFGAKTPSSVNRHGILHGRISTYGSELNSYRVILLLDVMVRIAANP